MYLQHRHRIGELCGGTIEVAGKVQAAAEVVSTGRHGRRVGQAGEVKAVPCGKRDSRVWLGVSNRCVVGRQIWDRVCRPPSPNQFRKGKEC